MLVVQRDQIQCELFSELCYSRIQCILLQMTLQKMFAVLVYKLIIQKRNMASAYLVGYSAIIPAAFAIPYILIEFLDIQNKCLKLSMFTLPTVVGFRAVEAMHEHPLQQLNPLWERI